ncbi:hypothetical protein E6U81_34515 [Streptomyces sp. A0592]|nr:hypothetical protein E6U81_34515 [Streptomyces sp. A0592]
MRCDAHRQRPRPQDRCPDHGRTPPSRSLLTRSGPGLCSPARPRRPPSAAPPGPRALTPPAHPRRPDRPAGCLFIHL